MWVLNTVQSAYFLAFFADYCARPCKGIVGEHCAIRKYFHNSQTFPQEAIM
jgi:hypothetical protein